VWQSGRHIDFASHGYETVDHLPLVASAPSDDLLLQLA
jgi:hypothetical protein